MALGKEVKTFLDVPAGDGIKRAGEPIAEIEGRVTAIAPVGDRSAAVAGDDVVLTSVAQRRQGARLGTLSQT